MYKETARNLLEFIGKSPSVFHVIDNLRTMLLENGFAELSEKEQFLLEEGKDYFVTRNDSSIVAFRMPRKVSGKETAGFRLVATHSDSPTFKVKHNPEMIAEGKYVSEDLTEALMSKYLYSADVPDPELIIRPSGEMRTSNFLLWQSAYSEYVFLNVLWPDFGPADLDEAIEEYHRRNRRFGGT